MAGAASPGMLPTGLAGVQTDMHPTGLAGVRPEGVQAESGAEACSPGSGISGNSGGSSINSMFGAQASSSMERKRLLGTCTGRGDTSSRGGDVAHSTASGGGGTEGRMQRGGVGAVQEARAQPMHGPAAAAAAAAASLMPGLAGAHAGRDAAPIASTLYRLSAG
eukprot:scaffold87422_cov19-Tisochrysis_lutea.AAC.1